MVGIFYCKPLSDPKKTVEGIDFFEELCYTKKESLVLWFVF